MEVSEVRAGEDAGAKMIKRRNMLKMLAGGAMLAKAADVKRVLVMFKCHLDVGFTDTQAGVMKKYFDVYYPEAMKRAAAMRESGADRYTWTTGSWLLYEYLEQSSADAKKKMEQAIAAGDIAWHALPFSWQTEVLDRTMIAGALGFSKSLDARFGRTTAGAKMTDVPGHTLGVVGPLAENGVRFLHIGVNSASTPPDVPALFVWKDGTGATLIVMYQHKGYGGVVRIPGSDLAVAIEMADDNAGPHSLAEIRTIYGDLRKQFPGASVTASNLSEIANAVYPYRDQLPVMTDEIGDTWIHGVPSDPIKVARYREIARLRKEWIADGTLKIGDATDLAFLRKFALFGEHTWGTDTKTYLDHDHYKPADLDDVLEKSGYQKMITSWAEKRKNIDDAVAGLPAPMKAQAVGRLARLKPVVPSTDGLSVFRASKELETAHFVVALDEKTGAIRRLLSKSNGREWASPEHPLALFCYQTFSADDYARFMDSYVTSKADWAPQDFGKPNIEHFGARSRSWTPSLANCWSGENEEGHRLLARLRIDDVSAEKSGVVAWPEKMYLELLFPKAEPVMKLAFYCFGKKANRLPEAMWLTFQPDAAGLMLEKSDYTVDPFAVVPGGNRHMHALSRGLRYKDFSIDSLDAPVVALGEKSPIYFSKEQPDLKKGVHFSLYNNTWGTNYIQWFGEDLRFRFEVRT
ncbi:MAG TPA: DUF5054 domain-containing protein [Bryobacteraceae bacterium]|jgi:hypothetical protein|nr:DUF5054 domain-containing protein [Bryobacteraceae bacterium]